MYKLAKILNGEISYYTVGNGEPFFLLHGFGGTFLNWEPALLEELSKKFTVYCINYRGIGFSKSSNNQISIYEMAQDIAQMMDVLNIQSASILGYSMGGYVAQEFAFHFCHKIKNLYLVSTSAGGSKYVVCSPEVRARMSLSQTTLDERVQDRLELNFPKKYHDAMRENQKKWVLQNEKPETLVDENARSKQLHAIKIWRESFDENKINQYQKINVPTTIFTGLKDIIVRYQNSINLCEMIPDSKMIMFEDGGHGLLSQFPVDIGMLLDSRLRGNDKNYGFPPTRE